MATKVRFAEILKADLRVGNRYQARTPKARQKAWLRCVLAFSEQDLSHLSEGDWLNLRYEVGALACTALPSVRGSRAESAEEIEETIKKMGESKQTLGNIPSQGEVVNLQGKIRSALNQLLSPQGSTMLGPFTVKFYTGRLDRMQIPPVRKSYFHERIQGGITATALYQVATMIGKYGAMVERCPEPNCQHLFLADRTNQRYCSTKCQSKTTSREYRENQHKAREKIRKRTFRRKKARKGVKHGKKA